jgi:hypothetical protein
MKRSADDDRISDFYRFERPAAESRYRREHALHKTLRVAIWHTRGPAPEQPTHRSNYFRPGCNLGVTKTAHYMHKGELVEVVQDPCAEPSTELQSFLRKKGLSGDRLMRAGRHIARNGYPNWNAGLSVWQILQRPKVISTRCTGIGTSTVECETSY